MTNAARIVLGTRNRKKGQELADLLRPLSFQVQTLDDFPQAVDVDEDGQTFLDNAAKKATQQARALGCWVLGEDSGLCVDALGGAPGVYSARYAGPNADDAANNRKLLEALREVPLDQRGAHYVCCMVLADPQGKVRAQSEGRCFGRIALAERGSHGFGYDPLFEIPEYHQTFGMLGPAVKRVLSHRGRALRQLVPQLARLREEIAG